MTTDTTQVWRPPFLSASRCLPRAGGHPPKFPMGHATLVEAAESDMLVVVVETLAGVSHPTLSLTLLS